MMEIYFDEINETEVDDFELYFKEIRVIGSGSYGTVIQAIYLETNEEVAVKIVRKDNKKPNQINKIKQEVNILKQLKHKNIIEFKNYIETNSKLYIIMEYIENGTLKNLIDIRKTEKNQFTDEEVSSIMKSLFEAINYLHSFHIVHRDLKPENILIYNRNDFSSIKLADFGLSTQYFEIKEEFEFCGTLIYMAPEQIVKKFYSKSIDIWSCGIIMYILLNFIHPLYRKGDTKNIYLKKLLSPNWKFIQNVSPMAYNLFLKLVYIEPSHRYSSQEALKHPFITRKIFDPIPLTYLDSLKCKSIKMKMKEVYYFVNQFFGMVIFLKLMKINSYEKNKNGKDSKMFFTTNKNYRKKCEQLSKISVENYIENKEKSFIPIDVNPNEEESIMFETETFKNNTGKKSKESNGIKNNPSEEVELMKQEKIKYSINSSNLTTQDIVANDTFSQLKDYNLYPKKKHDLISTSESPKKNKITISPLKNSTNLQRFTKLSVDVINKMSNDFSINLKNMNRKNTEGIIYNEKYKFSYSNDLSNDVSTFKNNNLTMLKSKRKLIKKKIQVR